VASQDELRRQLIHLGLRVTQATLSRDLRELHLVKTTEGYQPLASAAVRESPVVSRLARAVNSFLLDIRPAQNMLILKTPPGGAQPLAAAVDSERWKEVAGTLAGDDTVLIITPSMKARASVQKRIEEMVGE
jgi:transcriptional regulator of arginine metabolism